MRTAAVRTPPILIVTGEASGDLYGAGLIQAVRRIDPGLRFFGVGGKRMEQAGCDIIFSGQDLAVMGLVETFGHIPKIHRAFCRLRKIIKGPSPPKLLVLIDFAEFNLRLASEAKRQGIPVLYYVSPQVWAWRPGRVRAIAERVDRMAVIFPFEPELYRNLDIEVEYVGHPLLDEAPSARSRSDIFKEHGLDQGRPVIGLFPGSRHNEIRYIFRTILDAGELIHREKPEVQFLLPVAPTLDRQTVTRFLDQRNLPVVLARQNLRTTAAVCDAVITVSGTATLETALAGTPMVIVYKMAPFSYFLARRLVDVPFVGLVNIVAGRSIVPELIQEQATPTAIATEILKLLDDSERAAAARSGLAGVRERMGESGCAGRVARMVVSMIETEPGLRAGVDS